MGVGEVLRVRGGLMRVVGGGQAFSDPYGIHQISSWQPDRSQQHASQGGSQFASQGGNQYASQGGNQQMHQSQGGQYQHGIHQQFQQQQQMQHQMHYHQVFPTVHPKTLNPHT